MFLNVRLMIAAVAASIGVLVCGFSLFAAFRVNHEPLSRLVALSSPLTLAADNAAPAAPTAPSGTPFDARLQSMPPQVAAGAATSGAPAPAADAAATQPAGSGAEGDNVAPQTVASDAAATSGADTAPAQEKEMPPAQTAATEPAAATEPDQVAAATEPDQVAGAPNPAPAAPETVAVEPSAAPTESAAAVQQVHQDAEPETTAATPAATAASEPPPPAEQSPPDTQSSGQANQETKPGTIDKRAAEPAHKKPHHKARRTKVAAKPPVSRSVRPAVASTGTQPAYAQRFATLPTYSRGTENSGVGGPFVPVVAKNHPAPRRSAVTAKPQTP